MENCLHFDYIAVDTEGYAPNILGISVAHPGLSSIYYPVGHKEAVNIDQDTKEFLFTVLKKVRYRVFHHAGHDLIALPELHNLPFACTMIMGHMVDENLMSKSLDYMHKYYCGHSERPGKQMTPTMKAIIDSMGWEWVPYSLMYNYGAVDATITMELFMELLPRYTEQFGPLWTS